MACLALQPRGPVSSQGRPWMHTSQERVVSVATRAHVSLANAGKLGLSISAVAQERSESQNCGFRQELFSSSKSLRLDCRISPSVNCRAGSTEDCCGSSLKTSESQNEQDREGSRQSKTSTESDTDQGRCSHASCRKTREIVEVALESRLGRRWAMGAAGAISLQVLIDTRAGQAAIAAAEGTANGESEPKRRSGASRERERVEFTRLENGVQALDIREGTGAMPKQGDKVAVHYYARLAAKQGWRFDSTYDHKDEDGVPEPFEFVVGSPSVIAGLSTAVKSMRVGGTRRAVIPPTQGYQSMTDEPLPPNYFDRQRLFTTIFNPTRLQNGEGSTLGTLVFDIQLLGIRQTS